MNKNTLTNGVYATLVLAGIILAILAIVKWPAIQNYFTADRAEKTAAPLISLRQASDDLAKYKYDFILPKSKVTPAYYEIFNKTLNEILLIDEVNRKELTPTIERAKISIESKDYLSLSSIAKEAQLVNDAQKGREAILANYTEMLSAANKTITDGETVSMTEELIKAARQLNDSYIAYSSLIDKMIVGNVTAQTVTEAQTIKDNMAAAINASREASGKILAYLNNALKADIEAIKASTTVKK